MPLRNILEARGGPANIFPRRILLPGCASSIATSTLAAHWPYSKLRLAPPIGKSWPGSRSRCAEWSKGGAERKKKSLMHVREQIRARAASTSSGTGRSSRKSMRRPHLHSLRSLEWCSVPAVCTCMYGLLREGGQPRKAVPAACRAQARRCGKNESYGENPRACKTSTLQTPTIEATMHLQCL